MIDHLTYQVPVRHMTSDDMTEFMALVGMHEVPVDLHIDPVDADYTVRWFEDRRGMGIRLVGVWGRALPLGLGHWCVKVPPNVFDKCAASRWVERHNPDSPLGRLWLRGPAGLRVEVQPGE
jgi:hypothetical protein